MDAKSRFVVSYLDPVANVSLSQLVKDLAQRFCVGP